MLEEEEEEEYDNTRYGGYRAKGTQSLTISRDGLNCDVKTLYESEKQKLYPYNSVSALAFLGK